MNEAPSIWQRMWTAFWGKPTKAQRKRKEALELKKEQQRQRKAAEVEEQTLEQLARQADAASGVRPAGQAVCPMCQGTDFRMIRRNDYAAQGLGCLFLIFMAVPLFLVGGCLMGAGGIAGSDGGKAFGVALILGVLFLLGRLLGATKGHRKCRGCGYTSSL